MKRLKIALALLVVLSSVMAVVPVTAATTDTSQTEKITGSPQYVAVDTSNITTARFDVRVYVGPNKNGNRVLMYREEHRTNQINNNQLAIGNFGAYENVTVKLTNLNNSDPAVVTAENGYFDVDGATNLFVTGGDAGFTCGILEGIGSSVFKSGIHTDCGYTLPGSMDTNTTALDSTETHTSLYKSALDSNSSVHDVLNVIYNRLQDAKTQALLRGQNAYVSALNAGASKSSAKANATQAISDYYSVIERNLLAEWNEQVSAIQFLRDQAANETGLVPRDVLKTKLQDDDGDVSKIKSLKFENFDSVSVTLSNGSTVSASRFNINVSGTNGNWYVEPIGPESGAQYRVTTDGDKTNSSSWGYPGLSVDLRYVIAPPPTSSYSTANIVRFEDYENALTEIDTQEQNAINSMETVINNTYSGYTSGDINKSELISPLQYAAEYSPGSEYQTWAAAKLSMLGVEAPTNLSSTGYMNVSINGTQYQGLLMSQANPSTGQFEVNTTYNPANINGSQWLAMDSRVREITKNFTITDIKTSSGTAAQNFTIQSVDYTANSATNMSKLYDTLNELKATLEARQSNFGGGAALFGGSSMKWLMLAGAAASVLFYLEKNDKNDFAGGSNRGRR